MVHEQKECPGRGYSDKPVVERNATPPVNDHPHALFESRRDFRGVFH